MPKNQNGKKQNLWKNKTDFFQALVFQIQHTVIMYSGDWVDNIYSHHSSQWISGRLFFLSVIIQQDDTVQTHHVNLCD